jgi:small conductance mechanosensitive channel
LIIKPNRIEENGIFWYNIRINWTKMHQLLNTILGIKTAYAQLPFAASSVSTANEVAEGTQSQFEKLFTLVINQIPLWITGGIVIFLSIFFARAAQSIVENKMAKSGVGEEHQEVQILAGRIANVGVLTVGITVGLKIAGIDLTQIIAAAAFGIGFALKDLITNFLAGVFVLASRHFTIGDIIKVKGTIGKIEEIQTRATIVKNFDGTKVVVPNAELFKNNVTSFTSNPFRRFEVITGVEYSADLKKALEACMKAVKETKNVLIEPKPSVGITDFADSAILIKTKGWVESKTGVIKPKSECIQNIKKELDAVGITIPFPIRTIYQAETEEKGQQEEEKIQAAIENTNEEPAEPAQPMQEQSAPEPQAEQVAAPPAQPQAEQASAQPVPEAQTEPATEQPSNQQPATDNPKPFVPTWLKKAAHIEEPKPKEPIPGVTPPAQNPEQQPAAQTDITNPQV